MDINGAFVCFIGFILKEDKMSLSLTNMELLTLALVVVTFFLVIVTILAIFFSTRYNKKTLEQAERMNKRVLEQSEKNLDTQLIYKNRKEALYELNKIIREQDHYQSFKKKITDFLNDLKGQFIPDSIRNTILAEIKAMDEDVEKNDPYKEPEPSDKEIERYETMAIEEQERMTPEDRFEEEFKRKLNYFRGKIIHEVKERIKKPTKN